MIAAAARMSGTSSPFASVLYRGVIASWSARIREISRARAAVRARASRALRACDADAEYAVVRVARGSDVWPEAVAAEAAVEEEDFLRVDVFCAASVIPGRQTLIPSSSAKIRTSTGRITRTNPPRTESQRLAGLQPI